MRSNFLQLLLENKGASTIVPNSLEVLLRSIQKSHRLRDHKKQNFAFFIDIFFIFMEIPILIVTGADEVEKSIQRPKTASDSWKR